MRHNRSALFRGRHFADEIIALCVRWYLRFSLSYRDLEELMTERNLSVDHTTVWRWVQRCAPELNRRVRRELKRTGTSWRVDETYVRVAGRWVYLFRAVDSSGATLDFYLSENQDAAAAKRFFDKVLAAANHPRPRVINVDGNPSYPKAVKRLKQERRLGRRCRCRTSPYLNNIVEQDHRAIKRRINAKQGFRSLEGARRTIPGYEVVDMIRKGQVRWLLKGDVSGTGALVWAWDPVPRDPSDPARATWRNGADRTGAANVWGPMSADPERDLVFLPTTSPSPDFFGGERRGENR